MSLSLQAKLLQVIQEKRFFKLGSNKEIRVNVRILSATNQKLEKLVSENRFREDLYYRLKVIQIDVPSLRDRKQDLFWLIPGILDSLSEKNHMPPVRLTEAALRRVWTYEWPGNIRELENCLESAMVLSPEEDIRSGLIAEESLPESMRRSTPTGAESAIENLLPQMSDLATLEKRAIRQALLLSGGNRRLAAALLGISERTLYRVLGSEAVV